MGEEEREKEEEKGAVLEEEKEAINGEEAKEKDRSHTGEKKEHQKFIMFFLFARLNICSLFFFLHVFYMFMVICFPHYVRILAHYQFIKMYPPVIFVSIPRKEKTESRTREFLYD